MPTTSKTTARTPAGGNLRPVATSASVRLGVIAVAPIKLALHLTTAFLILTFLVWTARRLRPAPVAQDNAPRRVAALMALAAKGLVALLLLQVALGALVAGSKAGLTYKVYEAAEAFSTTLERLLMVDSKRFCSAP